MAMKTKKLNIYLATDEHRLTPIVKNESKEIFGLTEFFIGIHRCSSVAKNFSSFGCFCG
jgi:hypothetical protein